MSIRPWVNLRTLLPLVAASLLLIAVACGGTAAEPRVIEKQVIVEKEVIKEVPVEKVVVVEKEVVREVVKEVPVEVIKEVPVEVIKEVVVVKEKIVEVVRPTNTPVPLAAAVLYATPVPSGLPKYGSHVNMWAYADTRDWDPLGSASLSSVISYSQLYNQLVQYDTAEPSKVVCDLCTSWDVSNGGRTFTFHINPNIRWHDGQTLTADDVVFALQRYMNPEVSIGRSGLFRNYTLPKEEGGVRAVDRNTVEFNLQFPSGAFIRFLAIDYVKILPKHLLEQDIDLNNGDNVIKFRSGSGPFMLDEYQRGNFYKVSKNPNYFKEGRPFFSSIDHFIIVDRTRAVTSAKAGQVEMRNSGGSYQKEVLELEVDTKGEWIAHVLPPSFNVGLMLNPKKKPMTDPRIRKAIYLALDRQQINELVMDGTGGVNTIFPPGMAYSPEEGIKWPGVRPKTTAGGKQDLVDAKKLMAEAGFPDGFKVVYDVRQVSFYTPLCQVIKEQLKATLGIDGDIRTWESASGYAHYNKARSPDAEGDWIMACQGEGTTVLDFDGVYGGVYRKGATRNYSDWSHPLVEEIFEKQKVEQDVEKRRQLNRQAADFLSSFEDNHYITVLWGGFFWPMHRDIKGFHPPQTVQYGFKHEDLWLDR